jgi:hypothetical protein
MERKKILGLPIGPREPSVAERLRPAAIAVAGLGAIAVGTAAVTRKLGRRSAQDGSADPRSARADMQRQLKAGDLSLEDALDRAEKDDAIARTRVKVLLQSLPGVGSRGAVNAMDELGIAPNRRVGGLGSRQRDELLERFANNGN